MYFRLYQPADIPKMKIVNPEDTTSILSVYMKLKIGESIRRARLDKNYTQEYLAQKLSITPLAYGNMERGKTELTLTRLEEIAKVLDTTPESLLTVQDGFSINAPVSNANVGNGSTNTIGISEGALNNLTQALNRMCVLLESKSFKE